jgi:hypothetical protein
MSDKENPRKIAVKFRKQFIQAYGITAGRDEFVFFVSGVDSSEECIVVQRLLLLLP